MSTQSIEQEIASLRDAIAELDPDDEHGYRALRAVLKERKDELRRSRSLWVPPHLQEPNGHDCRRCGRWVYGDSPDDHPCEWCVDEIGRKERERRNEELGE